MACLCTGKRELIRSLAQKVDGESSIAANSVRAFLNVIKMVADGGS